MVTGIGGRAMTSRGTAESAYIKSTFYEQLVEHVFISEVLQEVWYSFGLIAEVLRSEVDASGYDVVIDCNGILRHIQLKTSKPSARVSGQNVNVALAEKPSGCVVWLIRKENLETPWISLSYRFFGSDPGKPLPSLTAFKIAKHTTAKDAEGRKKRRMNIRVVPKSRFVSFSTARGLVERLFGLRPEGSPSKSIAANGDEAA
jgi:hypothetical protein